MKRYVLTHPEFGVYLGGFWGMGFWSKLDPAGQPCAVTFPSKEEAHQYVSGWEAPIDGLSTTEVDSDAGEYISMQACVAAGLEGWLYEDIACMGGLQ